MNRDSRNRVGYIFDLLFYIILPIVIILLYVLDGEKMTEEILSVLDVIRVIVIGLEIIGVIFISSRKRNSEYTSLQERKDFEVQISNELDIGKALLANVVIVSISVGLGALWYYSYLYLSNTSYFLLAVGGFVAFLIYLYFGQMLFKANMKGSTMFWAGVLCLFIAFILGISTYAAYLGKSEMWVYIMTITIIFIALGIGYCISGYKIKKNKKKSF